MREFLICLILFALAVGGFYLWDPYSDRAAPKIAEPLPEPVFEPNIVRRDVTPKSALPAPELPAEKVERLPAVLPPPPPPKPQKPNNLGRVVGTAAGILQGAQTKIRLADIEPVPLDKICAYEDGQEWPCGKLARTEQRQLIRGRPVECEPVDNQEASNITTRCFVGGYDMSAWLVWTGWATPVGDVFQKELAEAKAEKRGQWRTQAP